jgi:hypothetical protein
MIKTADRPLTASRDAATTGIPAPRTSARAIVRFVFDFGVPTGLFYVLRASGFGIYASLLIPAIVSALTGAVTFVRRKRFDVMSVYMATMMFGSVAISLVSGSTRFLLAREAVLTGVTGIWFIASLWARRPLAYLFSKPLLEGRLRWPSGWDSIWDGSPRFRRMWRISSLIWGVATLADAALRVVMAYTLSPDAVPGLGTLLYAVTTVVAIAATNVLYFKHRVFDPRSPLYAGATTDLETSRSAR